MRRVFRTTVEIPLEDYIKMVLLIAEGEYKNLKEIINEGIEKVLDEYTEGYFKELEQKHADLVAEIRNAKSVVERGAMRRWKPR